VFLIRERGGVTLRRSFPVRHRLEARRIRLSSPAIAVLGFALLLSAGCSRTLTAAGPLNGNSETAALEQLLFSVVNAHRTHQGLNVLEWDESIAIVCRKHCRDMASGARDVGHGGMDFRVLMVDSMLDFICFHENVSSVEGLAHPASYAYIGWRESPTHRRNMEASASRTGVGAWISEDGVCYFVQIYIRESDFGNSSLSYFD
jgi:uncharacterized protein YkwD